MSSSQNVKVVNLIAGEDLRGDVYEILKVNASGQVIKTTAVTDTTVAILAEEPRSDADTTGTGVPVVLVAGGGVGVVKAGATITAGQLLVPDATAGRVAGVTGAGGLAVDSMSIGVALDSAVDGDEFRAVLGNYAAPHSA